jgi:hypothetical protein
MDGSLSYEKLRIFVLRTVFMRVLAENFDITRSIGRKSIKIINIFKLGAYGWEL